MSTPALAALSLALLLGVIGLVLAVRWAARGLARLADALNADAVLEGDAEWTVAAAEKGGGKCG